MPPAAKMSPALKFCGRTQELDQMIEGWRLASNLDNPTPQLVLIKAERGVGKTRLALEFYRWLSEQVDAPGEAGYWPDALGIVKRNLEVNPDTADCNFSVPIPYLWWGLRAGDPGTENGISGNAIPHYKDLLLPHLVLLSLRARMLSTGRSLAEIWLGVGVDVASSAVQFDTILTVGKGLFKSIQLLRGEVAAQSASAANQAVADHQTSLLDTLLGDLEGLLDPNAVTFARTPAVIFIDDAQFAREDRGLITFIERLMHRAISQHWPLMLIVTHWKRELSPDLITKKRSFADVLRYARFRSATEPGPAAGVPGSYLSNHFFKEIDLPQIDDLSDALADKLPGLLPEQSAGLLERVDGNPRFLEQIIALALSRRSYFENRDPAGPLSEGGFDAPLTQSVDVYHVVFERLMDAPEAVREAIACAIPQGVRFARSLANQIATTVIGNSCNDGLARAEDPYSIITGAGRDDQPIAAFAERLFYEVALDLRNELERIPGGGKDLDAALRTILIERLTNLEATPEQNIETRALTLGLAANIFQRGDQPGDLAHALDALARLATLEKQRYAFEAALDAAERYAALHQSAPDQAAGVSS